MSLVIEEPAIDPSQERSSELILGYARKRRERAVPERRPPDLDASLQL
jgi:hypothetical protein